MGIAWRMDGLLTGRTTAIAATCTVNPGVANTSIDFSAVTAGSSGNLLHIEYLDPGAPNLSTVATLNGSASSGYTVSVQLGTDGASAIIATAANVRTAVANGVGIAAVVSSALSAGSDGTGVVTAQTSKAFTGGRDVYDRRELAERSAVAEWTVQQLEIGGTCSAQEAQQLADALLLTRASLAQEL